MRKRTGLTGPESGQGTVEYILVLVVVIIIILTFLYNFNGAFKTYASAFFDGYISCILETGELPGTGGSCMAEFKAYDPGEGKNLLKDNLPEGSGGGGKGGGKKGEGKEKPKEEKKKVGGGGGGETMGGGGGGRTVVGSAGDSGRRARQDVGKVELEKTDKPTSEGSMGASSTFVTQRSRDERPQSVQMQYRFNTEEEKKEETRPSSVNAGSAADDDRLRGTKGLENPNRGLAAKMEDKERSFSIGEFIRFVLIILIVVAMVIFFGGQLMQITRSRDKGGD